MPAPEAAVHEDDLAADGKDEVGRAGQVTPVQAEAVAEGVDETADGEFGRGVSGRERGTCVRSGRWGLGSPCGYRASRSRNQCVSTFFVSTFWGTPTSNARVVLQVALWASWLQIA